MGTVRGKGRERRLPLLAPVRHSFPLSDACPPPSASALHSHPCPSGRVSSGSQELLEHLRRRRQRYTRARPVSRVDRTSERRQAAPRWPCSFRPAHHRASDRTPRRSTANARRSVESDLRSHQRDFERRQRRIIPQQAIRQTMRVPVHRAAHRHTSRLKPPAAKVLHGREHAGTENRQPSHRSRRHELHASRRLSTETARLSPHRTPSSRSGR